MTEVAIDFVELGLRIGRHLGGFVDSYYGPAEVKERTDAEELREPRGLVEDALSLRDSLDGLEETRRKWLEAQLLGLETVARKLAGEEIAFEDEVERCYGVRPRRTPESEFEQAHRGLDAALPGDGSLAERYRVWREEDTIPDEHLSRVIDAISTEARRRAANAAGLPEGESVEYEYVTGEPWIAFNYYLGGLRSRVSVNTGVPMVPDVVVELVVHETYPGHHTEHAWKEQELVGRGQLEESIVLIGTPQSIVSEGIASLAEEIAFGEERYDLTASWVEGTGVPYDPDVSRAAREAWRRLGRVGVNAAFLLHVDGRPVDEAVEYLEHWALASEKRARHSIDFINDPMWRSYVSTYSDGYELCRNFANGDPARFKRLLTEQLTPTDLA